MIDKHNINMNKKLRKNKFEKNGVIVLKTSLNQNKNFQKIIKKIYRDLNIQILKQEIKKYSGYIMGNLNVYPGKYGEQLFNLIISEKKILRKIEFTLGKKIKNFDVSYGGNLVLPKKGKQLFHIDGSYKKEMILISIVSEKITNKNAPTEVCIGSHKKNFTFSNFYFSKKRKKKLLQMLEI